VAIPRVDADPGLRVRRPVDPLPDDYRAVFARTTSTDPVGDATPGAGADVTSLSAEFSGGVLSLELTFDGTVATPGSGSPNAIDVFIDIDADRNGSTGMPSWTDTLRGLDPVDGTGLGIEYYVDFLKFENDTVELYDDLAGEVLARIPAVFAGNMVTVQVPLALLGGNGDVHVAAVVYQTSLGNVFDAVPNQGFVQSSEGPGDGSPGVLIDTGDTSPCNTTDPDVLCLGDGDRFEVIADWSTTQGTAGAGVSQGLTDDTGYFWFFDLDNVELVIKVLDACGLPDNINGDHFWVFAGGLTNVEVQLRVRDTDTGLARLYSNPQRTPFQPIQDTVAFSTCP